MRIIRLTLVLLLYISLTPLWVLAQNLVPNPGFETLIGQPSAEAQLNLAQPWKGLNGTPDLYYRGQVSLPLTACDQVDVPVNAGGFTEERTGKNGYAGIRFDLNINYREYISAPLAIPLQKDTLYRVEFYVQRADSSRYACNKIGALFTNNIPIQPGTNAINFPANIESNIIITDTSKWVLVTGIYKAIGGENYITIGLFRGDADPLLNRTDFGPHFSNCDNIDNSAYYFIDDVLVKPANESVKILGDTIICPNEGTVLTASSNVPFWWSDSNNPTDTLSLDVDLAVVPSVPTTYYLHGFSKSDSVTVTIVNPPYVNLGPDSLLCEGDTVLLDAFIPDGIQYYWSTRDTSHFIAVTDTGTYWVLVDNSGCARADTINFTNFLPNPPVDLGLDSLYCFFIGDTLRLDAGVGTSYSWIPTGETTQKITILSPAYYSVTVIRSNGCPRTAALEVLEVCVPTVYIPTAFTPDGDGLNDLFQPKVNNVYKFNIRVLNRFGQTIFYSEDPDIGWDGTYKGNESPTGVYVYRINYEGLNDEGDKLRGKKLGTITLLR